MNCVEEIEALRTELKASRNKTETWRRYAIELEHQLNTPELHNFADGVVSEAQHQRTRWGSEHDAGKTPEDWFWLLGYLSGKALRAHNSAREKGLALGTESSAADREKALHHTISSAAALANWHAAILGQTNMRPGLAAEATENI